MKIMMRAIVTLLAVLAWTAYGGADEIRCQTDCNARCPTRWIKLGVFKTKYRDPSCKGQCETSKAAACRTGLHIPGTRGVIADFEKLYNQSCALPFEAFTKGLIVTRPFAITNHEHQHIEGLKSILIESGAVPGNWFTNVTVRFAKLGEDVRGTAPDRNTVFLNDVLRNEPVYGQAKTLAHEMKHIEQYGDRGTDAFKCRYSLELIQCGLCKDRRHELEREAYEFEDIAARKLVWWLADRNAALFSISELSSASARLPARPSPTPPVAKPSSPPPPWNTSPPPVTLPSTTGEVSLIGVYGGGPRSPRCTAPGIPSRQIYLAPDEILMAVDDCGQVSRLEYIGDNRIKAIDWGGAVAESRPDRNELIWNNDPSMIWYHYRVRLAPMPRR